MKYIHKPLIVNIILISVAVMVSYNAARMVRNAVFARTQSADMIKKIQELEGKKRELEMELAEIQTHEAIEREAKDRLNLKNPGEEVVVVVPQKEDTASSASPKSFWYTIRSFFHQ